MRRATITIPDELERAVEAYRRGLKVPPALAAVVQPALREYLTGRGYLAEEVRPGEVYEEEEFIPSKGGKPEPLKDAPKPKGGGNPVSDAAIEDRR